MLIFGEPGLEKDNLAALVHFSSPEHGLLMARVDCKRLDSDASVIFGRGRRTGLLSWIGNGCLLLNDIAEVLNLLLTLQTISYF